MKSWVYGKGRLSPIGDNTLFKKEDEVCFLVFDAEQEAVEAFLKKAGWQMISSIDKDLFSTSSCHLSK